MLASAATASILLLPGPAHTALTPAPPRQSVWDQKCTEPAQTQQQQQQQQLHRLQLQDKDTASIILVTLTGDGMCVLPGFFPLCYKQRCTSIAASGQDMR
jgi:hypothetical protein